MSKDTHWFKHDYNARRDPKIIRLCRIKGMKGLGIYWSLIEMLHEQDGKLNSKELNDIAFELREDEANLLSVIKEFELFCISNADASGSYEISNTRVLKSIQERTNRSSNSRDAAYSRWGQKDGNGLNNATALPSDMPTQSEDNAIREDKSRIEDINGRFAKFIDWFNLKTGKKCEPIDKVKKSFGARLKKGYTPQQFEIALSNMLSDAHHIETGFKYITPEFLLRQEKLDRFLNMTPVSVKPKPEGREITGEEFYGSMV